MRRAVPEDGPDNADEPSAKKPRLLQPTMAKFFRTTSDKPLSNVPLIASDEKLFRRECPYCDFVVKSDTYKAIAGPLSVHMSVKHPFQYFESSIRVESALSYAQRTIFDILPMPTIEENEEGEDEEDPAKQQVPSEKPKRQRHSYSIKKKYKTIELYMKTEVIIKSKLKDEDHMYSISVAEFVSNKTGIPINTLKDWVADKVSITATYTSEKRKRKLKRLGSGRKPLFPKAEKIVSDIVREKRKNCKLVSKRFVLKSLQAEAEKENSELFRSCKFTPELISGFMRRNRLSLRFPSCKRTDNLEDSIMICRAFHRDLLGILSDNGATKYAVTMDPQYGRFLLKYRFNGDELPYRFGRVKSIVSEKGEALTHVTYPPGWEARLATLMLLMDASGTLVGPVPVIFQGAFGKDNAKRKEEVATYRQQYPNVKVIFQKKAWMDSDVLELVLKEVFISLTSLDFFCLTSN